ncbi:MAG: hypothetical protein GY774_34335 [Planctomycetes bacterium]|nr:hypothetical protein [Planctomycetota bacterium]
MTFCKKHGVPHINPDSLTICAYIEDMASQFKSHKSVANYVSAIRLMHKYIREPGHDLESFDVVLMMRAVRLTMRHIPFQRPPITVKMLIELCAICDTYKYVGIVIKMALLLGFLGLLRSSNICPATQYSFDPTRDLQRKDISCTKRGLTVKLKWSKSLQVAGQPQIIPLAPAANKTIDPAETFTIMVDRFPASTQAPLLSFDRRKYLTQSQLKKVFKGLLHKAGLSHLGMTLHSLRRRGSSMCFTHGAAELDIQRQGTWISSAYKNYIKPSNPHDSSVCRAMTSATVV